MPPRRIPAALKQAQANTDSVLHVHPSEGPNSMTVPALLTGLNYLA